jgi:hypothetical protein
MAIESGGGFVPQEHREIAPPAGESLRMPDQHLGIGALSRETSGTIFPSSQSIIEDAPSVGDSGVSQHSKEIPAVSDEHAASDLGAESTSSHDEVLNIGGPSETLSIDEWRGVIDTHLTDFKGNPDVAATMLYSFHQGKGAVQSSIEGSGMELPQFVIIRDDTVATDERDIYYGANTESGYKAVHIKQSYLEATSAKPDVYGALIGKDGEVYHRGSLARYYELTGVEEYHHAVFHEAIGVTPHDPQTHSTSFEGDSIVEYHALTIEYQALLARIDHAKSVGMPEVTVKTIEDLAVKAKAVREAQGLPTEQIDLVAEYRKKQEKST